MPVLLNNLNIHAIEFIKTIKNFEFDKEFDPGWEIIFPYQSYKWRYMRVSEYQKTFYVNELITNQSFEIETGRNRREKGNNGFGVSGHSQLSNHEWGKIFTDATAWLKKVQKNWIKENKIVFEHYPFKYRKGLVPTSIIAEYFPNFKHLQNDLGIRNTRKMVSLIEKGDLIKEEAGLMGGLTVNGYFEYCQLAYAAVGLADKSKSGRELYKQFADGRHEGLLKIDPDSEKEFADWIDHKHPSREVGGHPWEILRGGNTSNIQLSVSRPNFGDKEKFKIQIYATGISRLAESIKMFLDIYSTDKTLAIQGPNTIREQLLLLDNIGILPEYSSLHRGNQSFEKSQKVNQVVYFNFLKKHLSKVKPFITFMPLPVLKPKK